MRIHNLSPEAVSNWVEAYRIAHRLTREHKMTIKYTEKEAKIVDEVIHDFASAGMHNSVIHLQEWVRKHTEQKLKPCPFCGGEAKFVEAGVCGDYWVACKRCECTSKDYHNKTQPVMDWNKRADN